MLFDRNDQFTIIIAAILFVFSAPPIMMLNVDMAMTKDIDGKI